MKAAFWHDRWNNDQLGFHLDEFNPLLTEFWPGLGLPGGAPVFIPLCGKSLDMRWLHQQGHPIIGIDLSPIAIRDFFGEAGIERAQDSVRTLERSTANGFELYCGDLFDLTADDLSTTRACYDRGSLVALPPDLRTRYAEHLICVLPQNVSIFMITLEYDQSRMNGPPHSVPPSEVASLFGGDFEIERLWSSGWLDASPRFRERGLETRRDHVFRLDRGGRA